MLHSVRCYAQGTDISYKSVQMPEWQNAGCILCAIYQSEVLQVTYLHGACNCLTVHVVDIYYHYYGPHVFLNVFMDNHTIKHAADLKALFKIGWLTV